MAVLHFEQMASFDTSCRLPEINAFLEWSVGVLDNRRCWVCAGTFAEPFPTAGELTHVDCRTCGEYFITGSLLASAFPLPDSERYRFSFWSKRRQLEGMAPITLSGNTIDAIVTQLPNPATHEKADTLLMSLSHCSIGLALARIMELEIVPRQPGVTPFDADGFKRLGFVSEDPHVNIPDCGTSMPTASCAKAAELLVGPYARR